MAGNGKDWERAKRSRQSSANDGGMPPSKKGRVDIAIEINKENDKRLRKLVIEHQREKNAFYLKAIAMMNALDFEHQRQMLEAETRRLEKALDAGYLPPTE